MPQVQAERPRSLCPTGLYEFVLADVTTAMMPAFSGEGEVERWIWRFVSNKQDPETGQYYEVPVFTGSTYGNSRAKLTWLLDLLMPHATHAEKAGVNTDDLLSTHYEGQVKHETSVKDAEKRIATFAYLRPVDDSAADDPFATDDGAVDACEECGKDLTPAESKASQKRWGDAMRLCTRHGKEALQREQAGEPAAV